MFYLALGIIRVFQSKKIEFKLSMYIKISFETPPFYNFGPSLQLQSYFMVRQSIKTINYTMRLTHTKFEDKNN